MHVYDVVVDQPDTTAGDILADAPWFIGAVDAIHRVLAAIIEIERAGTQRVVGASRHAAGPWAVLGGIDTDHGRRRGPAGPVSLARDAGATAPRGALPPDTNAVAAGPAAGLDQIQEAIRGIDDDGAGRVAYRRFRHGAQELLVNLAKVRTVKREALIGDRGIDPVRAKIEPAEAGSRRDAT